MTPGQAFQVDREALLRPLWSVQHQPDRIQSCHLGPVSVRGTNPSCMESLLTTRGETHEEEGPENTAPSRHQYHTLDRHSAGVARDLHDHQPHGTHWIEGGNSAADSTWTRAASRKCDCPEHGPK